MIYYSFFQAVIGELLLISNEHYLLGLYMPEHKRGPLIQNDWLELPDAEPLVKAKKELEQYFLGKLTEFTVPIELKGTSFQCRVWQELRGLRYAETISYAELAGRIGNPRAVRAVANANARNPISIIVPCHRVIGSNGKLTGYAGGVARKEVLIDLELMTKITSAVALPSALFG